VTTETYTCDCSVCNGQAITAPVGAISGTPRRVRDLVHNYVAMTRNPAMAPILAQRGIRQATTPCYFCGTEVPEDAPRRRIYVPAIDQHVDGYVCEEDEPRLARRQAAAGQ